MTFNEYCIEWAANKGSGLPLTAKEFCNAVYQYAEMVNKNLTDAMNDVIKEGNLLAGQGIRIEKTEDDKIISISVSGLADLVEGSETVVIDISEDGEHLEVHLDADIVQKIDRAVLLPISAPTEDSVPVIGSNNAVSYKAISDIGAGSTGGGTQLYLHVLHSGSYEFFRVISTNPDQYLSPESVFADLNNIVRMFKAIDLTVGSVKQQIVEPFGFSGSTVFYSYISGGGVSNPSLTDITFNVGIISSNGTYEDTVTPL